MSYARKKPYISTDYEEMRSTRMDSEVFNPNSPQRVESEFKKPYLFDEHPKSEQTYTPPGLGPLPPGVVPPYVPGGSDCIPGGDAIGGGPNMCEPGQDCGQWIFSCAHKIISFTAIAGYIAGIRYGADDTVTVTACWDPDYKEIIISGWLDNGKSVTASFNKQDCAGEGADPECPNCDVCEAANKGPFLLYTTQQMSVDGLQYLKATGGGGGPYTWSITSGGGTLSTTETVNMAYNLYTAPSSNADCASNPTIKVTDRCGSYTTLKIAVNEWNGTENAVRTTGNYGTPGAPFYTDLPSCDSANNWWCFKSYKCSNYVTACTGFPTGGLCVRTYPPGCGGATQKCVINVTPTNYCDDPLCTVSNMVTQCEAIDPFGDITLCPEGIHDKRTAEMITGGCCPAILL